MRNQLRSVQTPEAIIAIAAEQGFRITWQQLRYHATSLHGDHWVWSQKGEVWRERFFAAERQLHRQIA